MFPGRNYAVQCSIQAGANVLCTNEATKRCVCCAVRYVMVIAVKLLSSLYGTGNVIVWYSMARRQRSAGQRHRKFPLDRCRCPLGGELPAVF